VRRKKILYGVQVLYAVEIRFGFFLGGFSEDYKVVRTMGWDGRRAKMGMARSGKMSAAHAGAAHASAAPVL
jgi:hypothetical protein